MAKTNGRAKLILLLITLAGILLTVGGTWAVYGKGIENNSKSVAKIQVKGTDLSQKHDRQIGIIEYRLSAIDSKQLELVAEQKAMRKENETAFKEILRRLPE